MNWNGSLKFIVWLKFTEIGYPAVEMFSTSRRRMVDANRKSIVMTNNATTVTKIATLRSFQHTPFCNCLNRLSGPELRPRIVEMAASCESFISPPSSTSAASIDVQMATWMTTAVSIADVERVIGLGTQ